MKRPKYEDYSLRITNHVYSKQYEDDTIKYVDYLESKIGFKKGNIITDDLINEVKAERQRQNEKWGEQTHPCLDQTLLNRKGSCTPQRMCENYEIPSETRAKFMCDNSFNNGTGTYAHIALEEFAEVISEFNINKRRIELVQLTAVCIAWIESIDRQK